MVPDDIGSAGGVDAEVGAHAEDSGSDTDDWPDLWVGTSDLGELGGSGEDGRVGGRVAVLEMGCHWLCLFGIVDGEVSCLAARRNPRPFKLPGSSKFRMDDAV